MNAPSPTIRRSSALRRIALSLLVTLVAAVSWSALATPEASAQDEIDPAMSLEVSSTDSTQPFRTIAVSIDPGRVGLAAIGATLTYDAEQVIVTSCSVSEVGACNVDTDNNTVLASVFNLGGIKATNQLLTVNFEAAPAASGSAEFSLEVDSALNFQSLSVGEIAVAPLAVVVAEIQYGSLTGDVFAADTEAGVFAIDVCAARGEATPTCTTTSGLGSWRLDDLAVGDYVVTIDDAAGVFGSAMFDAVVNAEQVNVASDAALVLADSETSDSDSDSEDTEPGQEQTTFIPEAPVLPVVRYEASISGQVVSIQTGKPVAAIQVCATQPLVLHQSCSTTDADGNFGLVDLSAGNYWVTTTDPLANFDEAVPTLVGVVGDEVAQDGIRVRLTPLDN